MNAIENYLANTGRNEIEVMNELQEQGLVSDNCVWARDVAEVDAERAVVLLVTN